MMRRPVIRGVVSEVVHKRRVWRTTMTGTEADKADGSWLIDTAVT